jgi:hypothetical protein
MATTRQATSTVVGVFEDRRDAERAVAELERLGFSSDQIGFITRDDRAGDMDRVESPPEGEGTSDTGTGSGAVTGLAAGGVLGGIIGAAAAFLVPGVGPVLAAGILGPILGGAAAGAAVGAVGGGIIGALVTTGVPEEEARHYDAEFRAGRTIVTVRAGERYDEASRVLHDHDAYDIDSRGRSAGGPPPAGDRPSAETAATAPFREETIRIPVRAEEVTVTKQSVVTGEAVIHRERKVEHQPITGTVRRLDVDVDERYEKERPAFQNHFRQQNAPDRTWEDAEPGYRHGYAAGRDPRYTGREFDDVEPEIRRAMNADDPKWEQLKAEVREGFRQGRARP